MPTPLRWRGRLRARLRAGRGGAAEGFDRRSGQNPRARRSASRRARVVRFAGPPPRDSAPFATRTTRSRTVDRGPGQGGRGSAAATLGLESGGCGARARHRHRFAGSRDGAAQAGTCRPSGVRRRAGMPRARGRARPRRARWPRASGTDRATALSARTPWGPAPAPRCDSDRSRSASFSRPAHTAPTSAPPGRPDREPRP